MMRRELGYFLGAVGFFTRLPVPGWVGHSAAALSQCARYFPAVGLLVGVNGGLTELYANLDIVPTLPIRGAKTLPAKLEEHKEMAFLSYQLATIKVDVPLDIGLDDLQMGAEDPEKLYELYSLLEFKSWYEEIQRDTKRVELKASTDAAPVVEEVTEPVVVAPAEATYTTILDQATFDLWLKKLNDAKLFAFDTETTGIDAQQAQLVGVLPGEELHLIGNVLECAGLHHVDQGRGDGGGWPRQHQARAPCMGRSGQRKSRGHQGGKSEKTHNVNAPGRVKLPSKMAYFTIKSMCSASSLIQSLSQRKL